VGEHGGVVGQDGNGYARVGGGDDGGAGGNRGLDHVESEAIDGVVHNIRSRLTYVELRSKLRSRLRA